MTLASARMPGLDGIRALAVCAVVWHHTHGAVAYLPMGRNDPGFVSGRQPSREFRRPRMFIDVMKRGFAKTGLQSEGLFFCACLAGTIALAWVSFRYFERPLLRLKDRFR